MGHQIMNNKIDGTVDRDTQAHKKRGSIRRFEKPEGYERNRNGREEQAEEVVLLERALAWLVV